jgi:tmRNA-binding protein
METFKLLREIIIIGWWASHTVISQAEIFSQSAAVQRYTYATPKNHDNLNTCKIIFKNQETNKIFDQSYNGSFNGVQA